MGGRLFITARSTGPLALFRSPRPLTAPFAAERERQIFGIPLPDPKLLLDANLARSLVSALSDLYPGSVHVADVGLAATRDRAIWSFAAANRFVLVTKDEDRQPSDDGVSDWMHERRTNASESGTA